MALTTNLVNYWKLDNNSFDIVGGFTGTDTQMNYGQEYAVINQGAAFNGNASRITCSSLTSIRSIATFSVSIWFYTAEITAFTNMVSQYGGPNQNLFVCQKRAAKLRFYVMNAITDTGTNYVETNSNVISIGKWYHVAMVFDGALVGGTNRAKIYLDGVLQTCTETGTIPAATTAGTSNLFLGCISGSAGFWAGYLDECGIWSKALTSTEAGELYNSGIGSQYPFAGTIIANYQTVQLCQFLLTSGYYRFSTARTNAIEDIQAAAIAGTVISQHDWNQFIYIVAPFYNLWLAQKELSL